MSTNNVIMDGEMHAPEQEGKKKREGLEIPDEGPQEFLCIGVVQLGTHVNTFEGKEKIQPMIMIIWEKADLKQIIYEEDTEARSFIKYDEMTFYTNTKSRLYKIAKAIFGKEKKEDDIINNKVNFMEMIGRRAYLNIEHVESKKQEGVYYPKITGYSVCKKAADEDFVTDGNQYGWYMDAEGKNFTHPAFANLPQWIREKIMESDQGKAHKEAGGKFAEPEKSDDKETSGSTSSGNKVKEIGVPEGWVFEDPNKEFTYSEYLAAGWTNKQMAKTGLLKEAPKKGPGAPPPVQEKKPEAPKPSAPEPDDDDYNPFSGDDDDDLPF